jgi:hypothetical protein
MKTNEIKGRSSDRDSVARTMSDVGIRTRQFDCMRAFQTGRSWYEAYWYPEPQPRHPGIVSTLVALLERWNRPRPEGRITELGRLAEDARLLKPVRIFFSWHSPAVLSARVRPGPPGS